MAVKACCRAALTDPCLGTGVADGVGGWRDYGVDPSQFSGTLMKTCERLVKEGRFVPSHPVGVLTASYYELLQNKVPLLGEFSQDMVFYFVPPTTSVVGEFVCFCRCRLRLCRAAR